MGRPVIFDDGGSIRIRLFAESGLGKMDGLLNKPSEHDVDDSSKPYSKVLITWTNQNGTAGQETIDLTTYVTLSNNLNDITVVITPKEKGLKIKIPKNNVDPQVRKDVQQNIYTVSNAGHINKIQFDKGPVLGPFIYASVVIV